MSAPAKDGPRAAPSSSPQHFQSPDPTKLAVERKRIVPIAEGARLRGVSTDTFRRTMRRKFIKLSPRRLGIRVEDALALDEGDAS
jgi:hypothetical protein